MNAVEQEIAWREIVKDSKRLTMFWSIPIPGKGLSPFKPYTEQLSLLDDFQTGINVLMLKARQIGMSTLVAFFCCWYAMTKPNSYVVIVSRNADSSKKLIRKIKAGYKLLPDWMKERVSMTDNATQRSTFSNGSVIESIPSRENAARGDTVDLIIVDEWAFLNDPAEAWAAIEPTADVGGQIIGLSTAPPNGYGTWFYKFCDEAKKGKNGFIYRFLSWRVATHRDDAWHEEKKGQASDSQLFDGEYADNDIDCWISVGSSIFDHDKLDGIETCAPTGQYHVIGFSSSHLISSSEGPLCIWEYPIPNCSYLISADVSKGGSNGDYNCASVFRRDELNKLIYCASWHGKCDTEIYAKQLAYISGIYNNALIVPERNGPYGVAVCDSLEDTEIHGKVNLYYTRNGKGEKKYSGFITTNDNKGIIIMNLRVHLYDGMILLPDNEVIKELKSYHNLAAGKMGAAKGAYDDRVMSVGIGCFIALDKLKFANTPKPKEEEKENFGLDTKAISWFPEMSNNQFRGSTLQYVR